MTSTPKAKKDSSEAAKRTVQLRNQQLKTHIQSSCGQSSLPIQTGNLLKSIKKDQRLEILTKANISPIDISPEEMVAMKVDLGVPWEKIKNMAR